MFTKKEWQRTCKRDEAHVWYVSKADAKIRKPSRMAMAGARMQAYGSAASFGGKAGAGAASLAMQRVADTWTRVNTCPTCGSQSFTQELVKL